MRILVTGAAGFIGGHVVREALQRNHEVVAMVRRSPLSSCGDLPHRPECIQFTLGGNEELDLDRLGLDAIVHLAASMDGDHEKLRSSVLDGGRQIVEAALRSKLHKMVCVSSISVLDFAALPAMSLVDESTRRLSGDGRGDSYAVLKAKQETIATGFCAGKGNHLVILRPGIVYDEHNLNCAHAGIVGESFALFASHCGQVPLIEVGSLAVAMIDGVELQGTGKEIMHLVDDGLPTQAEYIRELCNRGKLPEGAIAIPWRLFSWGSALIRLVFTLLGLKRKIPDLFSKAGFAGRLKPFRFSNEKARRVFERTYKRGF